MFMPVSLSVKLEKVAVSSKSVNMPLDKVMDTLLPSGMQSIFYFVMSPWLLIVCQPPPEELMTVMCHCCCSHGTCKIPRTFPSVKLGFLFTLWVFSLIFLCCPIQSDKRL